MPSYSVRDSVDVLHVQNKVIEFAFDVGFPGRVCQELAIVASELATNILKYGERGELLLETLSTEKGACLEVIAIDFGPPFHNLDAAMRDGWDDKGPIDPLSMLEREGIGGGLGAIIRLTDAFRVEEGSQGKKIVTRRYLRPTSLRAAQRFAP